MIFQSPGSVAFHVGEITIYWYGIILAIAFISGISVSSIIARQKSENPENILNLSTFLLFGAILGARLYFVLLNLEYYKLHIQEIFMTWHGGLSIHGAIIGGFIFGTAYAKLNKLPVLKYADIVAYGLILGQVIGRWGNFFNSEAFGFPTDLPWKLYIPLENRPEKYLDYQYFHPTFLYESLLNLIIFFLLVFIFRKRTNVQDGIIFCSYLIMYSIVRIFVESLRIDSVLSFNNISIAHIASIIFLLFGISGIIFIKKYSKSAGQ